MRCRIEYHMKRGNFIERVCKDEDHMDAIISDFRRNRKGIDEWTIDVAGRTAEMIVPKENVAFLLKEVLDEEAESEADKEG